MDNDLGSVDARPIEPRYTGETNRFAVAAVAGAIVLAAAGGGWYWWPLRDTPPPAAEAAAAPVAAPTTTPASAPTPEAVAQHPIEMTADAVARALPSLDQSDTPVRQALIDLLGAKAVTSMLLTESFVRHAVATVDNFGRAHAAPRLWPVAPTPGRFSVQPFGDGTQRIADANTARYAPLIAFATSIDAQRAADFYKSHYPLFQAAYRELGYPSGHFNDRLVEVIDLLLATPQPAAPLAVRLTEVKGPLASERPWVRWEFVDPALEALPAGQKMLLRMGSENADRLKTQLKAFRHAIAVARR